MQSTQRAGVTISIGAAAAVLLVLLLLLHTSPVKRHDDHGDFCDTGEYRKNVLKLVKEAPFAGLFSDLKNQTKFEASGVAFDPRTSTFLSVFDSSMSVGRIDETLQFRGPSNVLMASRARRASSKASVSSMRARTSGCCSPSPSRRTGRTIPR